MNFGHQFFAFFASPCLATVQRFKTTIERFVLLLDLEHAFVMSATGDATVINKCLREIRFASDVTLTKVNPGPDIAQFNFSSMSFEERHGSARAAHEAAASRTHASQTTAGAVVQGSERHGSPLATAGFDELNSLQQMIRVSA